MLSSFGIPGHIYSLDLVRVTAVNHPRVTFLQGNGRELEGVFPRQLFDLPAAHPFLVIEDADHTYETTLAVIKFGHRVMTPGVYLMIEKTMPNGGVGQAIDEFR